MFIQKYMHGNISDESRRRYLYCFEPFSTQFEVLEEGDHIGRVDHQNLTALIKALLVHSTFEDNSLLFVEEKMYIIEGIGVNGTRTYTVFDGEYKELFSFKPRMVNLTGIELSTQTK